MSGKDVADRWFDQFGPGMFQSRKELAAMIESALLAERKRCLAEVDVWLSYYRDDARDPNGQGAECAQRIKDAILALDKS